jgi:beta-barrel assembly-enhancing protease
VHYGLAVAHARGRAWEVAERELLAVRALKISSPIIERQLAEVRIARGDLNGGLVLYREAMLRYPLNQALNYGYGQALIGARRFADALRFVELQLQNYPQDIRLHKMRAESYAGLGRRSQQHLAQAEVLVLQGQTEPAIQQLVLAQGAADGNFYEMSVIDTRLRELRRRLQEEQKERRGK